LELITVRGLLNCYRFFRGRYLLHQSYIYSSRGRRSHKNVKFTYETARSLSIRVASQMLMLVSYIACLKDTSKLMLKNKNVNKDVTVYFLIWHEYVLHEGITYKSRVPRNSQMTSRLLSHTAAAMRAHNVLCNSYNTRPLLCARITCYVTVITVEINHCSFRRVRFGCCT
jgi:hypothetical protein